MTSKQSHLFCRETPTPRVALLVAYPIPPDLQQRIDRGEHPRMEILELARQLGAHILDPLVVSRSNSSLVKVGALFGMPFALALLAWRQTSNFDVFYCGNEQIGISFAILNIISCRRTRVVVLNHNISKPAKTLLFRIFGLRKAIHVLICLNEYQATFAQNALSVPRGNIFRVQYGAMVDGSFFCPQEAGSCDDRYVLSVGRESRDYETLFKAVRHSPVRVKIAASGISGTVRDRKEIRAGELSNVQILPHLTYPDLRNMYERCTFVLLPVHNVNYPAGITAIMEAMAMGKTVVATRSRGIQEFIKDSVTGFWIEPGDAAGLRDKMLWLWDNPEEAARMGRRARLSVKRLVDMTRFVDELKSVLIVAGLNGS